ncbi:MAG: molecular chaperone TorD family protein [Candidatus Competibacterales bacterium]|nr:molecular chaperone TorD family protein [Candidatus Competibacterales bacterium]
MEDQLRAGTYSLLAALLRDVPDAGLLQQLSRIEPEGPAGDELAGAWQDLRRAALDAVPESLSREFHELFIGLGRGQIVPYGSWYLTGFLMEKPLGELRRDLARLGFERQDSVREPEDHAAALCEVMAMLIHDDARPLTVQRQFFESHMGNWFEILFRDLEQAPAAGFYRSVARLGGAFTRLEKHYLAMPA